MNDSTAPIYFGTSKVRIFLASLIQSSNTLFKIATMFLTYVATGGFGLTVLVAGYIASAARMFDGITDPVAAWFVPSIRTRFGVARPTIFVGYFMQFVSILLLYHVFPGTGSIVAYAVLYFINIVGYTLVNQGNELLQNIITNDPKKRPLVFRYSATITSITTMFLSLYRSKVLFPKHGKMNLAFFEDLSIFILIVASAFVIIGLLAAKPVDNAENFEKNFHGATKFKFKDIWNLVVHNPAFIACFVSKATDKLASETASNTAVDTILFGIIIGNYAFSGDISLYNTIISLALIWVVTGGARKRGNRSAYIRWCWISIITAVVTVVFMASIDTTTISKSFIPSAIFILLYGMNRAFKSATNTTVNSMQVDIVDFEFCLHGKYLGPLIGAVSNILGKIFDSFSALIIAGCLGMLGYVETMPQPGDPLTASVFWVAMFVWLGIPALGAAASLIAMHWYPLTQEKMAEVQAENKVRREQNTAAYEAEQSKKGEPV